MFDLQTIFVFILFVLAIGYLIYLPIRKKKRAKKACGCNCGC